MNTRDELLAAIKANPADDTPRLMFADWLDEFGDCDRDAATAKFIRLCCNGSGKSGKSIPVAAGAWMEHYERQTGKFHPPGRDFEMSNAGKLIPTLRDWAIKVNKRADSKGLSGAPVLYPHVFYLRRGRFIEIHWRPGDRMWSEIIRLEYWRGFIREVECRYWAVFDMILPRLIVDQPLIEPVFRSDWCPKVYPERSLVWEATIPQSFNDLLSLGSIGSLGGELVSGGIRRQMQWRGDGHGKRARWAVCIALRRRAEAILAGDAAQVNELRDPFPINNVRQRDFEESNLEEPDNGE